MRRRARRFGKAVSLQNREAETVKVPRDLRVKARTGGNRQPQLAAQTFVDFAKEQFARVDAQIIAQTAVEFEQRGENLPHRRGLLARAVENLFVKGVPQARHARQHGNSAFLHAPRDFRRPYFVEINNVNADSCGQPQVGDLRIGVD